MDSSIGLPGNTHVVAYKHDENGETPVGAMRIRAGESNIHRQIDEETRIGTHTETTPHGGTYSDRRLSRAGTPAENEPGQIPGQMRFVDGVFGKSTPYPNDTDVVSWVHIDKGHERALGGLIATGIDAHGVIPHADDSLSEHGSRISRVAARRYGIKGHPGNPTMKPTFTFGDGGRSLGLRSASSAMDIQYDSETSGQAPREVTHEEAKAMEKNIKANMPKSKAKTKAAAAKAKKERIARNKAENVQLDMGI
jgi:hypothetical protein